MKTEIYVIALSAAMAVAVALGGIAFAQGMGGGSMGGMGGGRIRHDGQRRDDERIRPDGSNPLLLFTA